MPARFDEAVDVRQRRRARFRDGPRPGGRPGRCARAVRRPVRPARCPRGARPAVDHNDLHAANVVGDPGPAAVLRLAATRVLAHPFGLPADPGGHAARRRGRIPSGRAYLGRLRPTRRSWLDEARLACDGRRSWRRAAGRGCARSGPHPAEHDARPRAVEPPAAPVPRGPGLTAAHLLRCGACDRHCPAQRDPTDRSVDSGLMLLANPLSPDTLLSGSGALLVLAIILFAECGLLIGFFLPGDTLLFAAGIASPPGASRPRWRPSSSSRRSPRSSATWSVTASATASGRWSSTGRTRGCSGPSTSTARTTSSSGSGRGPSSSAGSCRSCAPWPP